jgi:FkbM family methyltransferase
VHAFEIAPPVFEKLSSHLAGHSGVKLNSIGLSDREGTIPVFYPESDTYVTTAYPKMLEQIHGYQRMASVKQLVVPVMTGDQYIANNKIQTVDVLKIDVEGMEESVLRGFEKALARQVIRLIQFEYNTTNIASKFLLRDAYDLFASHGYILGKLYPNYVEFRDYHYRHEDFCGPNMIAVRKVDAPLIELLSN